MKLFEDQTIKKTGKYTDEYGATYNVIATIRYDDQCHNGHNTFSITGVSKNVKDSRGESCGCIHDEISKAIPELQPYLKWHLCSSDGPLHYIADTVYLAGNRDYNGLLKGETRQLRNSKTGLPCWKAEADKKLETYVEAETCPEETAVVRYVPRCSVGDGKERELDAARRSAIWPEATDDELMQEPETLKKTLEARLPKLMEEFKAAVLSLGLQYGDEE